MTPLWIITTGFPPISVRMLRNRRLSTLTMSSSPTSIATGMMPMSSGTLGSSTGRETMLEISTEITSSAGCNSPNWRLPIKRIKSMMHR